MSMPYRYTPAPKAWILSKKDLEALEASANAQANGEFVGLINIVEQMTARILQDADKIMQLSDQ